VRSDGGCLPTDQHAFGSSRAVRAGRSDPPACPRDSVGPAQAPQTRLQMAMAFLKRVIVPGAAARRAPRVVPRPMPITQAGRSFQARRKHFSNTCQTLVHRVHSRAGATQRAQTAGGTRGSSGVKERACEGLHLGLFIDTAAASSQARRKAGGQHRPVTYRPKH
jgi:hypothetical protein